MPEIERLNALGFDATRERATDGELASYRYVHFATHGLLNSEHPELSGIWLSMIDKNAASRRMASYNCMRSITLKLPVERVGSQCLSNRPR